MGDHRARAHRRRRPRPRPRPRLVPRSAGPRLQRLPRGVVQPTLGLPGAERGRGRGTPGRAAFAPAQRREADGRAGGQAAPVARRARASRRSSHRARARTGGAVARQGHRAGRPPPARRPPRRRVGGSRRRPRPATTALGHPHADVQRAAAALLTRIGDTNAVAVAGESLAPSVAVEFGVAGAVQPVVAAPVDLELTAPVVATGGDVTEILAALLEGADDVIGLEMVLAGLSATPDPALLAPLRARATTLVARAHRDGEATREPAFGGRAPRAGRPR